MDNRGEKLFCVNILYKTRAINAMKIPFYNFTLRNSRIRNILYIRGVIEIGTVKINTDKYNFVSVCLEN